MKAASQPVPGLPVLTEVVVLPQNESPSGTDPASLPGVALVSSEPSPANDVVLAPAFEPGGHGLAAVGAAIDEAALTQRVLSDLDRQLDLMFEQRLREAMSPVLTRLTDTMVRELRHQLSGTLREMVARAVAQEVGRAKRG